MRKLYLIFLLSLFLLPAEAERTTKSLMQAMPQDDEPIKGIISYDYVWEYFTGPYEHELLHYGFTGEKEVDGVSYHVFKCIEAFDYYGTPLDLSKPPYSLEYLLRDDQSTGKVFACVTEDNPGFVESTEASHKEILIYDFSQKAGEEYAPWLWKGTFSVGYYFGAWGEPKVEEEHDKFMYYTVGEGGSIEIEGRPARVVDILYPDSEYKNNTLVEGIGCITRGILPVIPTDFYDGSRDNINFSRVLADKGEAIYENSEIFGSDNVIRQWIEGILSGANQIQSDDFTAPTDRIFDLHGRELSEPIPGQPYIKGGHIFMER